MQTIREKENEENPRMPNFTEKKTLMTLIHFKHISKTHGNAYILISAWGYEDTGMSIWFNIQN